MSRGLAQIVEKAGSQWGLPNGYVLGQEAGGAVVAGVRYGEGILYTKNAGDLRVYWQGPSVGFDFGGEGARTMMLVYNLPATDAIYQRFAGIDGSAYFVGGLGMTALTINNIVVVPIRIGRRHAARRQCGLSQIHADGDLEPVLIDRRGMRAAAAARTRTGAAAQGIGPCSRRSRFPPAALGDRA